MFKDLFDYPPASQHAGRTGMSFLSNLTSGREKETVALFNPQCGCRVLAQPQPGLCPRPMAHLRLPLRYCISY